MNLFPKWFTALFEKDEVPDEVKKKLEGKSIPELADETENKPKEQPPAALSDDAEKEAMRKQIAAMAESSLRDKADAYAQSVIAACKAVPAERASIATLYSNAVRQDAAGKALFSDDGQVVEGQAVAALKDLFDKRPAHTWTSQISGDPKDGKRPKLTVMANASTEQMPVTPEREEELLNSTSTGREIVAERKKKEAK